MLLFPLISFIFDRVVLKLWEETLQEIVGSYPVKGRLIWEILKKRKGLYSRKASASKVEAAE